MNLRIGVLEKLHVKRNTGRRFVVAQATDRFIPDFPLLVMEEHGQRFDEFWIPGASGGLNCSKSDLRLWVFEQCQQEVAQPLVANFSKHCRNIHALDGVGARASRDQARRSVFTELGEHRCRSRAIRLLQCLRQAGERWLKLQVLHLVRLEHPDLPGEIPVPGA